MIHEKLFLHPPRLLGSLTSFAAHLLRLHPIESGVDPDFKEDDGLRFEEHFVEQWELWLDRELGENGTNVATWGERAFARAVRHVTGALPSIREYPRETTER